VKNAGTAQSAQRNNTGVHMPLILTAGIVFGFLAIEAIRARRNEQAQRAAGGIEPEDDVYPVMRIAYPTCFAAMLLEGALSPTPSAAMLSGGAFVFVTAKALKWWAILTLGRSWTFRVIVVPGAPRISSGPYRFVRHPNYVAVIGELVGVAAMTGAEFTGPVATLGFAALIASRIRVEERALSALSSSPTSNV
jgi:methyltransferase